ncbi:hypothetical protein BN14_11644 [Rhizoctonia solani AG-1 IB]|uniref:Uncharacterized protein n=1 Tax=Thanatephorus cucumeris (strain AG1-IB / isolate 7/3/14) TaxID=1108050 RepID=M5CBZ4_THACB|nr:hypothetical protein BN14_11644 [Rhizoctonia solani AG-1 IB]
MHAIDVTANPRKDEYLAENAGRFTAEAYTITLDGNHEVLEHAINAASIGGVPGDEKKDGSFVQYPHEFRNSELLNLKLYKKEQGTLYEYPILLPFMGQRVPFGPPKNPRNPMQPYVFRVVYTINPGSGIAILQGLIGHKDKSKDKPKDPEKGSTPFALAKQFY